MSNVSIALADVVIRIANKRNIYNWVRLIVESEHLNAGDLGIVFCSDAYLLSLNNKFLSHDYYTDIITFDYSEGKIVSGELYISIDRVKENAANFGTSFQNELNRVIAHGILHLCGYKDKSKKDIKMMRLKEEEKLKLRQR